MFTMRHNSRLLACRAPQGAVPCGTNVRLSADVGDGDGAAVFVRIWRDDAEPGEKELLVPMTLENGRAAAEVAMPDHPCLMWYFFVIHTADGHTFYYGGESGEGMFVMHEPPSYQITVYDGAFETPRHLREGIAYQIFPDRFKRSSWEDFRARAQYHTGRGRFLRIHDRWSEPVCSEPSPGQNVYMPDDFFGGDLNGIRQKLPYLSGLGVTMLYLNPVFESPSNHRYDTADYHRIDPILGSEEEFSALCREAETYGIRIMLDGVFSHTGADSRYFDRFGRYETPGAFESQDAPCYSWYTFTKWPELYECWWGFPMLPNTRETEPSFTDFIAGESGVLSHWARAGARSWRLDVADELPDAFIRTLRKRVKQNDPDGVLMGEVWEDCSNKLGPDGRRGYVDGDELDCAMNYPFANAVIDFLTGRSDAYTLNHRLQTQREHYPRPFYEACFNLISSHDVVRAATALSGAPERNSLSRSQQRAYQPAPAAAELGRRRLILATALQAAMPGVPCVYYGDEAGMTGMADPFNRGTFPWGSEDTALTEVFRKLLTARKNTPALKAGLTRMGPLGPELFAVARYHADGSSTAALLINRSEQERSVRFDPGALCEGPDAETPVPLQRMFREVLTGKTLFAQTNLTVTLPPLTAELWIG